MHVKVEHLQIVHYYYFFMGVFSFFSTVLFSTAFPSYGLIFSALFVAHLTISWYISWVIMDKLREEIIFDPIKYALSHVFITFITAGASVGLWYFNIYQEWYLLNGVLLINFFVLFTGVILYLITRFDVIGRLFTVRSMTSLKAAKSWVASGQYGMKPPPELDSYQPGTDEKVDHLLSLVWDNKDEPEGEDLVKDLYTTLCERKIEELREKIKNLKKAGELKVKEPMIKEYKDLIKEYERKIVNYSKA